VVLFVTLMGVGYSGTSVIYATSAADIFQGRHFGKILGIMEIGFGLGASLGSYVAGFVFDHFQTYRPSFYMVMGLMLASIAGIWIAAPRTAGIGPGRQGRVAPDRGGWAPTRRTTSHQRDCSSEPPD
jgi:MFS family permease